MDEELKRYLDAKFLELRVNRVEPPASPVALKAATRRAALLADHHALEALTESVLKSWEEKIKRGQTIYSEENI